MNIKISYQNQLLPPPYAYAAVLQLGLIEEKFKVKFDLEYLGRESMTSEELENEGFASDDGLSWQGQIDNRWKDDIRLLAAMEKQDLPDDEIYLHLLNGSEDEGFPIDINKANLIFQELMQAVLEKAELENPLTLSMLIANNSYDFLWKFSSREFSKNNQIYKDWEWGRDLMKKIYSFNFEDLSPMKRPSENCIQIDGLWYPLTKDLKTTLKAFIKDL